MDLHEYQAKQLLIKYNLPVPKGYVCTSPCEAEKLALKIGLGPWVVKCQVHAGGRAKSGGVKIVKFKEDVRFFAEQWLGKRLITYQTNTLGQPVNQILIEEAINIATELYLGVTIDYSEQCIVFIASTEGGVDIENIVEKKPQMIHRVILDPLIGPQPYQARKLAFKLGLNSKQIMQFNKIFLGLVTLFLEYDLFLIEINPLVITMNDSLICLDSKLIVDNNALFRQPELHEMYDNSQEDKHESYAFQCGLNYVTLNGNIGCMVNGAGLAMSTMDIIKLYGGEPANFLDVSGSVTRERVTEAFKIIISDKKVKAVLVNIFGGIVRCDLIADGIISAISEIEINIPVVVRLEGNSAKLGSVRLTKSSLNIIVAKNLIDAVQQVIAAAKGE